MYAWTRKALGVGALSLAAIAMGATPASADTASQQNFTAVGAMQQNACGSNIASLFFTTQQDFGECSEDGSLLSVADASDASQQTFTAIGAMQQNPCGSNIASLFFTTQQDFGECSEGAALDADVVTASTQSGEDASQQTFTAIGAMQQNPCGSNIASLFFTTQQDFGECSGEASLSVGDGEVASQQNFTAVGAMQQNPCGSNIASLFFTTQQDFGDC